MSTHTQTVNQRENCELIIESLIRSWNLNCGIAKSSRVNLSREATRCRRKRSFCRIYQKELVDEILASDIELQASEIERFLSFKFDHALRSILSNRRCHKLVLS